MESGPVSGLRPSNANVTDFELWIRMATDNKINANNSWNFALIDFFHDLSLLREGKSINFQKASATLDGCVKIYSSRVDSAATETGRLLSGLAASKYHKPNVEDNEEDEKDEENEEVRVKQRKKNTVLESTLVNSFEQIRTKKIDFEFVVDPVFKRALSDFDEGGSKSLLLNMLSIDSTGRILFDTTSDSKTLAIDNSNETDIEKEFGIDDADTSVDSAEVDINNLEALFFNNLEELDNFRVCPSMDALQDIVTQGADNTNVLEQIEKQKAEYENEHYDDNDYDNAGSVFFDNDDYEIHDDTGMGLGDNSMNVTFQKLFDETFQREQKDKDGIEEVSDIPDYDLLAYFDQALRKNWTKGHENWKVRNLMKKRNEKGEIRSQRHEVTTKKKDILTIDFLSEEEIDEDELFSESVARIIIPKHQWITQDKHRLPDDIHFTTKRLIHLFVKPLTILKTFNKRKIIPYESMKDKTDEVFANEEYWSEKYKENEEMERSRRMNDILREDLQELHKSYDQSFFQDTLGNFQDDNDYIDPMEGGDLNELFNGYGSQLVTSQSHIKPTHINFSKVAKRVDVKLLKNNLWEILKGDSIFNSEGLNNDKVEKFENYMENQKNSQHLEGEGAPEESTKFSKILNNLTNKYSKEEKNDLSTSFCFICLLHLANENGFTIENTHDNSDLIIKNKTIDDNINDAHI